MTPFMRIMLSVVGGFWAIVAVSSVGTLAKGAASQCTTIGTGTALAATALTAVTAVIIIAIAIGARS